MIDERCPFCGGKASVKDSAILYSGRSYGLALVCDAYPKCDSYTTTYREGRYMADAALRHLRKTCHNQYFDPLWKQGGHSRDYLYQCLQKLHGLPPEEAHFGKMNAAQIQRTIEAIESNSFLI